MLVSVVEWNDHCKIPIHVWCTPTVYNLSYTISFTSKRVSRTYKMINLGGSALQEVTHKASENAPISWRLTQRLAYKILSFNYFQTYTPPIQYAYLKIRPIFPYQKELWTNCTLMQFSSKFYSMVKGHWCRVLLTLDACVHALGHDFHYIPSKTED